jgi:YHS domain-containing protein
MLGQFCRLRREVHFGVVDTDSTTEVHTITPLEHFVSKHRNAKAHIPFFALIPSCRKDLSGRAAEYYIEHGGGTVTYIFSAEQVAQQFRSR